MIEYERGYYSNGQLTYEHPYQEGKIHGVLKAWYEDGQLQYEHSCRDGKLHGISRAWRKDRSLVYNNIWLYGSIVTKEEYRKHELIEKLSGL